MNINDLICPHCTLIFKFDIINYKESYIKHILVHLTDLSNERDNLTKILIDGNYNTFKEIIKENDQLKKKIIKLLEKP